MMTKRQALAEAKRRLGPTAFVRSYRCPGSVTYAGKDTTRGCRFGHLQPCPGGPEVFEMGYTHASPIGPINSINGNAGSWEDLFARDDARKEADRKQYAQWAAEREAAKPKRRRGAK